MRTGVYGFVLVLAAAAVPFAGAAAQTAAQTKARQLRGNPGLFFGADAYPPEAIRRGEEGRVVARLQIDPAGRVVSCQVAESSGSAALDKVTCEIAVRDVRFEPALDRKGREIASTYVLPVRWVLPRGPQEVPPGMMSVSGTMTVSIDEAGRVVACRADASDPEFVRQDPCAEFPADKQTPFLVKRDGRARGATIVRRFSQEITPDP